MEMSAENLKQPNREELADLPLDRIEEEIIGWAGHLAAATARWLTWLGEYDRREGWANWGCRSAAHWLSWKCGMSLTTGRAHVRVARALERLPLVGAAFAAGELSFSKVRALSRLDSRYDEAEMVEAAKWATAAQLDRIVAGCRQAVAGDRPPRTKELRYRTRPRHDGMIEVTVIVTPDEAARIDATIDGVAEARVAERDADTSAADRVHQLGGWPEIRARAAAELLAAATTQTGPDPVELVVEVDLPAGGAEEPVGRCATSGEHLVPEVVRRLSCDGRTGIGRRSRVVPRWLRRKVERRDRHLCRFPGCATAKRLHAHHIVHWTDGGPTDLDNLILLCAYHHHLVHDGGWSIDGPAGSPRFITPAGTEATIPQLRGDPRVVDEVRPTDLHALQARWLGEPIDYRYAVSVYAEALGVTAA